MTARTWVLERRTARAPLTTNGYMRDPHGYGPKAGKILAAKKHADYDVTEEWRKWAAAEYADRLWTPASGPVAVEVRALRKGRRNERIDVSAMFILAKAVIDGLTDAEMWPDDNDTVVEEMRLLPHLVVGEYGVRLTIRELTDEEIAWHDAERGHRKATAE